MVHKFISDYHDVAALVHWELTNGVIFKWFLTWLTCGHAFVPGIWMLLNNCFTYIKATSITMHSIRLHPRHVLGCYFVPLILNKVDLVADWSFRHTFKFQITKCHSVGWGVFKVVGCSCWVGLELRSSCTWNILVSCLIMLIFEK